MHGPSIATTSMTAAYMVVQHRLVWGRRKRCEQVHGGRIQCETKVEDLLFLTSQHAIRISLSTSVPKPKLDSAQLAVGMMIVRIKFAHCSGLLALLTVADRHCFAGLDTCFIENCHLQSSPGACGGCSLLLFQPVSRKSALRFALVRSRF